MMIFQLIMPFIRIVDMYAQITILTIQQILQEVMK